MSLTIYHNPRCSKSRQTLELIRKAGHEPDIRLYLEDKLNAAEIDSLLSKLSFASVRELMRRGESIYKELGLKTVTPPENVVSLLND